jgi:hypothetical protein
MTRNEILTEVKKFFDIEELVCDHTRKKWGENAWQFLDTDYLHCLLIIRRDILKKPMYCNGNSQHQRGLRCNMCALVKGKTSVYISSHILGKAGDFTVSGLTAEQARQLIKANANLLPCNVRIEGGVSWLHIDVLPQTGITEKVYEFKA